LIGGALCEHRYGPEQCQPHADQGCVVPHTTPSCVTRVVSELSVSPRVCEPLWTLGRRAFSHNVRTSRPCQTLPVRPPRHVHERT
jgi:hypothetical protein